MAQDSQNIDFLYDFLYVDKFRVNSWFAQLFNEGVLTTFKSTHSATGTISNGISGGIPGVAKGALGSIEQAQDSHERSFNTEWSLPLTLLDALDENNFIHKDLQSTPVGSLVLLSGNMQFTDVGMLQKIWDPASKVILQTQKTTHQNKSEATSFKNLMSSFGDILRAMPPEPQVHIQGEDGLTSWASLRPESMTVNASTLALAHGSFLEGTWHILAVLDAAPSNYGGNGVPRINNSDMADAMAEVLTMVRRLVGRDEISYSVSPVLIFRQSHSATAIAAE